METEEERKYKLYHGKPIISTKGGILFIPGYSIKWTPETGSIYWKRGL